MPRATPKTPRPKASTSARTISTKDTEVIFSRKLDLKMSWKVSIEKFLSSAAPAAACLITPLFGRQRRRGEIREQQGCKGALKLFLILFL